MKKPKEDITGKTFGHLLVIRMEHQPPKGFQAICKCLRCGKKEVQVCPSIIKNGHKKSCGCLAAYKLEDLTGQKFGFLEVKEIIREWRPNIGENGKFGYFAICKCSHCGKDNFKVLKSSLKRGSTTSCGCRRDQYEKMCGENHAQFNGYKEIRGGRWSRIKEGALKRNLNFNISIEEAWKIYESQDKKCALTGIPISFSKTGHPCSASLDRIDSTKGYTQGNCQWVLKDINYMKSNLEISYFIKLCKLVAENANVH